MQLKTHLEAIGSRMAIFLAVATSFTSSQTPRVGPSIAAPHVAGISVQGLRSIPQIFVDIQVKASDKPLFVPYCGTTEGGSEVLCVGATHLQSEGARGWQAVKLKGEYGVLGYSDYRKAVGRPVAPGTGFVFLYQFSDHFFELKSGQRIRFVVDVWADESALRSGQPPIPLATQPFVCCADF